MIGIISIMRGYSPREAIRSWKRHTALERGARKGAGMVRAVWPNLLERGNSLDENRGERVK